MTIELTIQEGNKTVKAAGKLNAFEAVAVRWFVKLLHRKPKADRTVRITVCNAVWCRDCVLKIALPKGNRSMPVALIVGQSVKLMVNARDKSNNITVGAKVTDVKWAAEGPGVENTVNDDGTLTIKAVSVNQFDGSVTATVTDADGVVNSFSNTFQIAITPDPNFADRTTGISVDIVP